MQYAGFIEKNISLRIMKTWPLHFKSKVAEVQDTDYIQCIIDQWKMHANMQSFSCLKGEKVWLLKEGGGWRDCEEILSWSMRSREIYNLEGSGSYIEKPFVQQEVEMVEEKHWWRCLVCSWRLMAGKAPAIPKYWVDWQICRGWEPGQGPHSKHEFVHWSKGWASENRSLCKAR